MKKLLVILLAAAMTASTMVGCTVSRTNNENENSNVVIDEDGNETNVESANAVVDAAALAEIHAKIAEKTGEANTGTDVVMNIAGYDLTLAEYEYMCYSYLSNAVQYAMYYGFEILEDQEFLTSLTDMFDSEIKTAPVVLTIAAERGITLTEEEFNESVLATYDSLKEQYGDEFEATFEAKATPSINSILYYNYIFALYDKILSEYTADSAAIEAELAENYIRAKHILLQFPTNEDGAAVTETQKAETLAKAEEVLAKIKEGADFDELIAEYNEDPGMTINADGYYFTYNEMVPEFEEAAFALEDNGVSDIVETSYGYHIIKKLPVDDAFKTTEAYTSVYDTISMSVASEAFYNDMQNMAESFPRTDVANFDELVAPVVAEAEEMFAEYEVQFNAMYGSTETEDEAEATDETAVEGETEEAAEEAAEDVTE